MARILIVYGSQEGQTEKVAKHIAELFRSRHHEVDLIHGRDVPEEFSVSEYDGVVVGASIHIGRYQKYMVEFARQHCSELCGRYSAFFTVCLTAKSQDPADQEQVQQYIEKYIDAVDWCPDQIGAFAGALMYSRYGLIKRFFIRKLSERSSLGMDPCQDYEYTDWESVDDFADTFLTAVEGKPVLA